MLSETRNALTIDVEEYFQVSNFARVIGRQDWDNYPSRLAVGLDKILSLLDEKGVRATFFVLGWIAERHPELIAAIAARGHEMGTHGYAHQLVYDQTPQEFERELRHSKDIIERITGAEVIGYRAPSLSITNQSLWALEILARNGIRYDTSIFPIVHNRCGIWNAERFPHKLELNGSFMMEFPCSTVEVLGLRFPFCGGGYLRLLPYPIIRSCIRRINEQGFPVMIYLHPWELDLAMPRVRAGRLNEFRHYNNIRSTEIKLRALLEDFRFTSARAVLGL